MNTILLKKMLDLGDAYEQQQAGQPSTDLSHFLAWAIQQTGSPIEIADERVYYTETAPLWPTFIAQYLTIAYRYFRLYVKKALETTPLLTFDDFVSLVYLVERGQLTKTELVETTINERTSGMLVIKRLVDKGFVLQAEGTADRRSRQLSITPEGMAMLRAVQPAMNEATTLLAGDLSLSEQQQLGSLLARLDRFHNPLFRNHRDASLPELLQFTDHTDR